MSSDNASSAPAPAPEGQAHQPQPFKTAQALCVLLACGTGCTVLAAFLTPEIFAVESIPALRSAVLVGLVVMFSSALSMVYIARSAARGPHAIANSFMLGMIIRMVTALAAVAIGIAIMQLPVTALLLTLALTYLPLLAVEVVLITRFLRRLGPTPNCRNSKPASNAGTEVLA